jgi:hypothetical protein
MLVALPIKQKDLLRLEFVERSFAALTNEDA